jgi:hypothetical protein
MPIEIKSQVPSICLRRAAFEASNLSRELIDSTLSLTADEFRVEGDLIVVGPLHGESMGLLLPMLEAAGLEHFEDYFDLSGNWPEWLTIFARYSRAGS